MGLRIQGAPTHMAAVVVIACGANEDGVDLQGRFPMDHDVCRGVVPTEVHKSIRRFDFERASSIARSLSLSTGEPGEELRVLGRSSPR